MATTTCAPWPLTAATAGWPALEQRRAVAAVPPAGAGLVIIRLICATFTDARPPIPSPRHSIQPGRGRCSQRPAAVSFAAPPSTGDAAAATTLRAWRAASGQRHLLPTCGAAAQPRHSAMSLLTYAPPSPPPPLPPPHHPPPPHPPSPPLTDAQVLPLARAAHARHDRRRPRALRPGGALHQRCGRAAVRVHADGRGPRAPGPAGAQGARRRRRLCREQAPRVRARALWRCALWPTARVRPRGWAGGHGGRGCNEKFRFVLLYRGEIFSADISSVHTLDPVFPHQGRVRRKNRKPNHKKVHAKNTTRKTQPTPVTPKRRDNSTHTYTRKRRI